MIDISNKHFELTVTLLEQIKTRLASEIKYRHVSVVVDAQYLITGSTVRLKLEWYSVRALVNFHMFDI